MKFLFLLITALLSVRSYSQLAFASQITANSNKDVSAIIKTEKIKSESMYIYEKKKNNKDSTLFMTQYFDSSGNLIERDEYKPNKELFRIINYSYNGGILIKQETITKSPLLVNGFNISKKVKTYTYDSVTKTVLEKEYTFSGDSLKNETVSLLKKEYDSLGYLQKEYALLPNGEFYLYRTYTYLNGILSEIKRYNIYQTLQKSYFYEYDDKLNSKNVFNLLGEKTLAHEYHYDDHKKLIMEKDYEMGRLFLDHITFTYSYNSMGLLDSEVFQSLNGDYTYYKYYYSK
jgi:hypothetical protein